MTASVDQSIEKRAELTHEIGDAQEMNSFRVQELKSNTLENRDTT